MDLPGDSNDVSDGGRQQMQAFSIETVRAGSHSVDIVNDFAGAPLFDTDGGINSLHDDKMYRPAASIGIGRRRTILSELAEPEFFAGVIDAASRRKSVPTRLAGRDGSDDLQETFIVGGQPSNKPQMLSRRLSTLDLTLIGVGASVGAHIYVFIGKAVHLTGPAVSFSAVLSATCCTFCALCYAELAARVPYSGSVYMFAYVALGEFAAVICGMNLLIDYHIASAVCARRMAEYIRSLIVNGMRSGNHAVADFLVANPGLVAVATIGLATLVLCVGVENGFRRINGVFVTIQIALIVIVIALGSTQVSFANWSPFMPYGWMPVLQMASRCSTFAYIGIDVVASTAEESKNPSHDIPRGIFSSQLISTCLYFFLSLVLCGILPYQQISSRSPCSSVFGQSSHANWPFVHVCIDIAAILGVSAALMVGLYCQARIYLSLARDGFFFSAFKYIDPKWKTPIRAHALCAILVIILSFFHLDNLLQLLSIGVLFSYSSVCAGVLTLRSAEPKSATRISAGVLAASVICMGPIPIILIPLGVPEGSLSAAYMVLGAVICASWAPALQLKYEPPETFACPLVPYVPLLGLTVNGFLLAQLHRQAWIRFLATTLFVMCVYFFRIRESIGETTNDALRRLSRSSSRSAGSFGKGVGEKMSTIPSVSSEESSVAL